MWTCFGGTLPYQAPEILSGSQSHPTKASECWSVGILMYVLLAGEFPFSGDTAEEILLSIHQDGHAVVDRISTDPSLERLIKRLLQVDQNSRPGMHEICSELAGLSRLMSFWFAKRRWMSIRGWRWTALPIVGYFNECLESPTYLDTSPGALIRRSESLSRWLHHLPSLLIILIVIFEQTACLFQSEIDRRN